MNENTQNYAIDVLAYRLDKIIDNLEIIAKTLQAQHKDGALAIRQYRTYLEGVE